MIHIDIDIRELEDGKMDVTFKGSSDPKLHATTDEVRTADLLNEVFQSAMTTPGDVVNRGMLTHDERSVDFVEN